MPDLRDWLNACGLEPLAGVLAANDVDLDILPDLTEQDLEKLGISLGHRRKLLRAVATLRETPAGAAVAADAAPPRESAVPAGAPEAQRRQVTVLFSDLVGSTALATALDPEDMSGLIRRYQDACAGAVARFDGYIAKFMGDGVLAYFGYPQAREDAAERSVRAALAIVDGGAADQAAGRRAARNPCRHRYRPRGGRRYRRHRRRARRGDRRRDAQSRRDGCRPWPSLTPFW